MLKLNMGCGHNKRPGFINVDAFAECAPDQVADLEVTPWPWPSDCADEVLFIHSLEHMGGDPKVFLAIMKELYRISADGCVVRIHAPHPRHDNFLSDPTHVRAITPKMMLLFDREMNDRVIAAGGANSPLARYLGVDFELVQQRVTAEPAYLQKLERGEITRERLQELLDTAFNVGREFQLELRVHKPVRAGTVT